MTLLNGFEIEQEIQTDLTKTIRLYVRSIQLNQAQLFEQNKKNKTISSGLVSNSVVKIWDYLSELVSKYTTAIYSIYMYETRALHNEILD